MFPRLTTFAIALLGAATIAAAPAHAGVIFSQDFSGGLQANEKLGGGFSVGGGRMGHVNGPYADNERSFYDLTLNLRGVTDASFSFDWTLASERRWDGWNLLAAADGEEFDPSRPFEATPAVYNDFVGALGTAGVAGIGAGRAVFDLNQFAGRTVHLRLQFASDRSITGAGAIFDNILVTGTPRPISGAPEPGAWALMILGFTGTGLALRRRGQALA